MNQWPLRLIVAMATGVIACQIVPDLQTWKWVLLWALIATSSRLFSDLLEDWTKS